ncbi:MAG: hypothetical protein CMP39_04160 [Rickettsiales bacterium]|nr:hypothetical protein [Rickettsiales bacterium]|tara:strand:- start:690 stop:914 length:225 start_codon:yes stop_codon:yes gene_type:complete
MKLRTAIRKSTRVFVTTSCAGTPTSFQVSKMEVKRVLSGFTNLIDEDLNDENAWSQDDGCYPYWEGNDLYLTFV